MTTSNDLPTRIDAEFAAAEAREQHFMAQREQEFQARQKRLAKFEQLLAELPAIWRPRLEALATKFGDRVKVQPKIEPGRRSGTFDFQSELAQISLRFSAAPDPGVKNLIVSCDLDILPILMKFERHSEIEFPLDAVDKEALGHWLDDRIVGFVKTYLALHENQYYLKDHTVEDPIAKVRFPKYAAGATLEHGGTKYYFLNEATCREFQKTNLPTAQQPS
jgi:YHS domain-containing protein